MKRALLVVDMSVEHVQDISYHKQQVIDNCRRLIDTTSFHLVVDSRLWLKSPHESSLSLVWPETGTTLFRADSKGASLIPELHQHGRTTFCAKNNYSCFVKSHLWELLQQEEITDVYICGINTDYCVFATALDSFQQRFSTFVVHDAVTSVRGQAAHEEGLQNLLRHFGPQVLVSTESIVSQQGG